VDQNMPEGMKIFFTGLFLILVGVITFKSAEHYFKDSYKEVRLY